MSTQDLGALPSAVSFLSKSQNTDGGWGYAPGQSSIVEPTAAAALALRTDPRARESYEGALQWLRSAQNPDGGWGLNPEDGKSGWQTAWALLALAHGDLAHGVLDQAAAWLLAVETYDVSDDEVQQNVREHFAMDPNLRGWPWRPGEASFVEPTALALLALQAAPATAQVRDRLDEAVTYLQDRRCPDGGWNVGNPVMFGEALPPRAHPTAWALLALARIAPQAIAREDLSALLADVEQDGGALALAWGVLALSTLGEDHAHMSARLASIQAPDGGWNGNPYHTAVAGMAIQGRF